MSTQTSMKDNAKQMWATGGMVFAAILMVIVGVFQIFEGVAAISLGGTFVDASGYAYSVNNTAFGWIHLGVGVVVLGAGLALFSGRIWARALAIALVVISIVANFFYLAYFPVWSLLIIALDVFIIWSIATAASPRMMREMDERAAAGAGYGGDYTQTGERWPAENPPGRHWVPDEKPREGETAAQAQERARAEARTGRGGAAPTNPPTPG
jgi:hypothetical protein